MKISIPFTQFEIRGHRPTPTGNNVTDTGSSGKRTFLPLKLKRRPDWAVLHEWAEQGPPGESAERRAVAKRITNFVKDPTQTSLSLYSYSTITRLPPFPAKLQRLDLVNCEGLTHPPDLTACKNLIGLDLQNCKNLRSPPGLASCTNLKLLNLTNCRSLETAPNLELCKDLDTLEMAKCHGLLVGPDLSACTKLRFFNLSDCASMGTLPALGAKPMLRELNLASTPLQALPAGLLELPQTCRVAIDLRSIPFSHVEDLRAALGQPGYAGPGITMPNNYSSTRPLAEQVNFWRNEANGRATAVQVDNWHQFRTETHASCFTEFLSRVRETSDYSKGSTELKQATQQRVVTLLERMQDDAQLRGACFNLASDAIETCGDRVALRFMDMETMCNDRKLEVDIRNGVYDQDPQKAIDQFKGQYRLQVLEEEANRKAGTPGFTDEVEVKLAYLTAFGKKHALPVHIRTMLYPRCAALTDEDKDIARRKISNEGLPPGEQQANDRAFRKFLAGSPLMRTLLNRWDKDGMTAAHAQAAVKLDSAIEKAANDLDGLMEEAAACGLDMASPAFKARCDEVARQRATALVEIPARATQPVMQRFVMEHQLDVNL
ncbi:NEL-type E3 ubiquitin ligase domain-containing protein [Actimicrobium antarcticum]